MIIEGLAPSRPFVPPILRPRIRQKGKWEEWRAESQREELQNTIFRK